MYIEWNTEYQFKFSNFRSSYVNSGPRSLPHMGSGKRHNGNGHNGARLSPPAQPPQQNNNNPQDDIVNYVYDSWNKVGLMSFCFNCLPLHLWRLTVSYTYLLFVPVNKIAQNIDLKIFSVCFQWFLNYFFLL